MARQTGLIQLTGTLDGINFYQTKYGSFARMKSSITAQRIVTDPAYERARENNAEFGNASKAGKLIRQTLHPLLRKSSDSSVVSRLMKLMIGIKDLDAIHDRGKRTVGYGLIDPDGVELLLAFKFNIHAGLQTVLTKAYLVEPSSGTISIPAFIPRNNLRFPEGATHFELQGGMAKIDFESGKGVLRLSPAIKLPIDEVLQSISLVPIAGETGSGFGFYLLNIVFYQELNDELYPLKNGAFNALHIVEVTGEVE